MKGKRWQITISEMAKLHGVSRQTLIHYDKIGLFKPEIIEENGYRYYSLRQIPFLREICFLRSLKVPLNDIHTHLNDRTPQSALEFFEDRIEKIQGEIQELEEIKQHFQNRVNKYTPYLEYPIAQQQPILRYFPQRKVAFTPYEPNICKETLHKTLMRAWRILTSRGYFPSSGFGTVIRLGSARSGDFLKGAGSYVVLPDEADNIAPDSMLTLPAGDYVTMFKYAMPYDVKPLNQLLDWIDREGYHPQGDIVDACILDTTFYSEKIRKDFCQLQILIRLEAETGS